MNFKQIDEQFKQRFWYCLSIVLAVLAATYVFVESATYILVIVMGLIFAVVVGNLISLLRKKTKAPNGLVYALTWLSLLVLPILVLYFSGAELGQQVTDFTNTVRQFGSEETNLPEWVPARGYIETELTDFDFATFMNENNVSGRLGTLALTLTSILTGVALLMFIALYVSLDPKLYKKTALSFFAEDSRPKIEKKLTIVSKALSAWMLARLISMAAVTVLTFVGLLVLDVPQALFLSVLAGLFSFVPNIGPLVAIIPAALVAVLQGPMVLVYVLILYLLVQTLESYLITPLVEQRMVITPPATLIGAQVIFGILFGLMGVILAAPLLAVVFALRKDA